MSACSPADTIPVRLTADRLRRPGTQGTRDRLRAGHEADLRHRLAARHAARGEMMLDLAARGANRF